MGSMVPETMTGTSYRVATNPMVPGSKADDKNFQILESMPVRGIITNLPALAVQMRGEVEAESGTGG